MRDRLSLRRGGGAQLLVAPSGNGRVERGKGMVHGPQGFKDAGGSDLSKYEQTFVIALFACEYFDLLVDVCLEPTRVTRKAIGHRKSALLNSEKLERRPPGARLDFSKRVSDRLDDIPCKQNRRPEPVDQSFLEKAVCDESTDLHIERCKEPQTRVKFACIDSISPRRIGQCFRQINETISTSLLHLGAIVSLVYPQNCSELITGLQMANL